MACMLSRITRDCHGGAAGSQTQMGSKPEFEFGAFLWFHRFFLSRQVKVGTGIAPKFGTKFNVKSCEVSVRQ